MDTKHGLLLLDKPEWMTSHQLVHNVRKIFDQKQVGHCGTLDPMATGLMLILMGRACKLSSYFMSGDKTYHLRMKLGMVTDSLDTEGEVTSLVPVQSDPAQIRQVTEESLGPLLLEVPRYSAIKFQGKKLYEYAREKKEVPPVKKTMHFYGLKIQEILGDELALSISCHKGSYIRSWVHFIGQKLGYGACLINLRREISKPYLLEKACTLDQLTSNPKQCLLTDSFISFNKCLLDFKSYELRQRDVSILFDGYLSIPMMGLLSKDQKTVNEQGLSQFIRLMSGIDQSFLGLIELRPFESPTIKNVFRQ